MPYIESPNSTETCTAFFLTRPININLYCQLGGEIAKTPLPATPIDGALPPAPAVPWSVVEAPPLSRVYIAYVNGHLMALRLNVGATTIRACTTAAPFKIQDITFRVWPMGKTVGDPNASMTPPAKERPLSTSGWGGTLRERRTLFPTPKSSGNR